MNFNQYETNSLMTVSNRPPLVFVSGQGSWLTDHDGKRYLDFVQGWAVNCLGHAPECVLQALADQAGKLINPSPAFYNEPAIELASLLTAHSNFDRVFFASSGAEANEGAVKLARKWGRFHPNTRGECRHEIICFQNGFHGRTLAMMSASGKPGWDTLFAPPMPGFAKAEFNNIASVESLVSDKTVAVMLEPVQGEGGVIPADPEFMRSLAELTRRHGLLLIVDEVQTGMGRTGALFGHQHAEIEPDIMTLGKGIGAGVPLAALLCREEVACFEPGDQGGTYTGNPLMAAVGVAVFKALTIPGFLSGVKEKGERLAAHLARLSAKYALQGERGQGLLRALRLGSNTANRLVEEARESAPEGLLLNAPRPDVLRFMPALNVDPKEIDRMAEMLDFLLAKAIQ